MNMTATKHDPITLALTGAEYAEVCDALSARVQYLLTTAQKSLYVSQAEGYEMAARETLKVLRKIQPLD